MSADFTSAKVLWRRLDAPGHDACRLLRNADGWMLDGTAVFLADGFPARLSYEVACDPEWRTRQGLVRGWFGDRPIGLTIRLGDDGIWTLGGVRVLGLEGCVDLDLGFTPATNVLPIRRLALAVGGAAEAPAAWFDPLTGRCSVLRQRYERRTEDTYWYESPSTSYSGLLDVSPTGFVRAYPGLWESER